MNYTSSSQDVFWKHFLDLIEDQVNSQSFNTWFKPLKIMELNNSTIVVSVPKPYFSSWLEEHYTSLMESVAQSLLGRGVTFTFIHNTGDDTSEISTDIQRVSTDFHSSTSVLSKPSPFKELSINPRFTFDSFVVGQSNQFAHAASKAIAEAPGTTAFNPLVIYGGVGLGKTHLLQAIAIHIISKQHPGGNNYRVIYASSEKFTMDFIMSIQNNLTHEHSKYYRSADILIVDDIQFFNNKERTQEEFFHIFNTLHQQGKQIALSMDKPPSQLKGLADRLINRFQWGLVTDIQSPDFETRVAIIKKKAETDNVELDNSVAEFIAEHITSNIRELEGSLIRLLAFSSLHGRDISLSMAEEVLIDTIKRSTPHITIEIVQKHIAEHFSLSQNAIIGNSRRKEVALARHIAIYLCKKLTDSSLKTIGLHFGGRDHSTVIHSLNNVENKLLKNPAIFHMVRDLTQKIQTS